MTGSQEGLLLEAVLAAPDDDGPRHDYAAWLRRRGDPRGEFIELQLRHAAEPDAPVVWVAAEALFRKHGQQWAPRIAGLSISAYRRGFAECIFIGGEDFVAGKDAIFAQLPVCELALWRCDAQLARIAAVPELARLRRLSLAGEVTDAGFRALMESPHLGGLEALEAGANALGVASMRALADAPWTAKLASLSLPSNPLGDDGLAALSSSAILRGLTELNLLGCGLTAAGVASLARSPVLGSMRRLRLNDNQIGSGLASLGASERATSLTHLELADAWVDDDAAVAFAASTRTAALVHLDLARNFLSDRGATALANSGRLSQLASLDLSSNAIREAGALALAESIGLPALRELGLSHNAIYIEGVVEEWQDWTGSVVGEGPVKADSRELGRRYGRRLKIN